MSGFRTWHRDTAVVVAAYAIASGVAGVTILLATGAVETLGAGLLAPLFLVPSMMLYVLLARVVHGWVWKHVGYLTPAVGIIVYLLIFLASDRSGYVKEGSGLPLLMLVTFGIPAVVTYLFLLRIDPSQTRNNPTT